MFVVRKPLPPAATFAAFGMKVGTLYGVPSGSVPVKPRARRVVGERRRRRAA